MLCVLMSFVIPFLVLPCMTRSIAEKGLKFHNRTLNKREEFCFLVLEFYLHLFMLPQTWIEQNRAFPVLLFRPVLVVVLECPAYPELAILDLK